MDEMRFLSEDWFWQAHRALTEDEAFAEAARGATFRLWLIAEAAPDWARDVTVVVGGESVELDEGCTGKADAVGRARYADWLAMLRHELHPRKAVLTGKLRGSGPVTVLRHYKVIDTALDVLRSIPVDE